MLKEFGGISVVNVIFIFAGKSRFPWNYKKISVCIKMKSKIFIIDGSFEVQIYSKKFNYFQYCLFLLWRKTGFLKFPTPQFILFYLPLVGILAYFEGPLKILFVTFSVVAFETLCVHYLDKPVRSPCSNTSSFWWV